MANPTSFVRVPTLKGVDQFRQHVASLQVELPCEDGIVTGPESPLAQPIRHIQIGGRQIGNRYAVQPMEGWDGTRAGGITDEVRRRWQRFGESGAKLICGGEAMAVRPDGRANPNQLVISRETEAGLAELCRIARTAHRERYGTDDDLVIGFQLTHSGRFCKPHDHGRLEPRVAYRHPLLDPRFGVNNDTQVFTDTEIESLIEDYVAAARVAVSAGADFVDIKHCHGYLLHEFLSARTRPGKYGGSFENRTRVLREIVAGMRAAQIGIDIGVRLSAFDFVPFRADPASSVAGRPGRGIPEDYSALLPYPFAFGVNAEDPVQYDLAEAFRFAALCRELGVKILNVTAGSPYYNPHIQRPAAYPPSDGYQPPEDPLVGVARQVQATKSVHQFLHESTAGQPPILVVGSAYSYLQEYLPHVAQFTIRQGWTDIVGIGRMVLSYPTVLADAQAKGALDSKQICRTFSDCTTAPRNGLISGCYPLDRYYANKPEAQALKGLKRRPAPE